MGGLLFFCYDRLTEKKNVGRTRILCRFDVVFFFAGKAVAVNCFKGFDVVSYFEVEDATVKGLGLRRRSRRVYRYGLAVAFCVRASDLAGEGISG